MSWGHRTGTVHDGTGRGHHADGGSPIDANSADGRDHSAHYLFLIIGTPLVAFLATLRKITRNKTPRTTEKNIESRLIDQNPVPT